MTNNLHAHNLKRSCDKVVQRSTEEGCLGASCVDFSSDSAGLPPRLSSFLLLMQEPSWQVKEKLWESEFQWVRGSFPRFHIKKKKKGVHMLLQDLLCIRHHLYLSEVLQCITTCQLSLGDDWNAHIRTSELSVVIMTLHHVPTCTWNPTIKASARDRTHCRWKN